MSEQTQESTSKSPMRRDDHGVLKTRCCDASTKTVDKDDGTDHPVVVCVDCGGELGSPMSILAHAPAK